MAVAGGATSYYTVQLHERRLVHGRAGMIQRRVLVDAQTAADRLRAGATVKVAGSDMAKVERLLKQSGVLA